MIEQIHLTLDEINELNERLEQSRFLKNQSVIQTKLNYLNRCRDIGIRPDFKPDKPYLHLAKEIDEVELPSQLQMKTENMYNVFLSIDPCYYKKGGWYPINYTIKLFRNALINYYKKNLNRNLKKSQQRQFDFIIFTHLYKIKNNSQFNYLKKFYPEELSKHFAPHLHIVLRIDDDKINHFCNFIKKYIKKRCNPSNCNWKLIGQTTQDQIRTFKYGFKFGTTYFTKEDIIQGKLYDK